MLITTESVEIDPSSVVHIGKYTFPGVSDPGFFRYRDSDGRLVSINGISHEQLDALAAAMPRPVHFADDGSREDWLSKDHVAAITPGNPFFGRILLRGAKDEELLYLDLSVAEADKLFEL